MSKRKLAQFEMGSETENPYSPENLKEILEDGVPKNLVLRVLSWLNLTVNVLGVICLILCIVMFMQAELFEDIAVMVVAFMRNREPQANDYHYAYKVFFCALFFSVLVGIKSFVVWLISRFLQVTRFEL